MSQGHKDLMETDTIARNMDIEPLNVDQSLCGHQISIQGGTTMQPLQLGLQYKAMLSLLSRIWSYTPKLH